MTICTFLPIGPTHIICRTSLQEKPECPVKVANKKDDVLLGKLVAFKTLERDDKKIDLKFFKNLNKKTFKWAFDLLKKNMETICGEEWDDEEKKAEMKEEDCRYLILADESSGDRLGFVHFRFVYEETVEVLYVYEIQLEDTVQRKGLGKFLMQAQL